MGVVLILILLALSVGWNVLVVSDALHLRKGAGVGAGHWLLLILGTLLFALVIGGLIVFIVFHARQIRDNQLQKNFLDAVTHEFRSPLTSLRLYLDTLRLRDVPALKTCEFYALMAEDVDRLQMLVEQVLEAGRAEHRARTYRIERVQLAPRIQNIVSLLRRRHNLAEEAIRTQLEPVEIEADPAALDIVLHNLVENAIKYSHEGQVLVLVSAVTVATGTVEIRVSDEGVGIPKRYFGRIFKRFYRLGNELTRTRKGTGLGLFLVREIVRGMRGKVWASSQGENLGSTFTVMLPGGLARG